MIYSRTLIKFVLCIFLLEANPTWAEVDNRKTPVVKAVQKVGSAVVNINTEEDLEFAKKLSKKIKNEWK